MLKKRIDDFMLIKESLGNIQESINLIQEQSVRNVLWQAAMPKLCFTDFLPTIPYLNGVFDFKLKRVERYRQPGVDSLLKSYMQYMARDAKDFDFTK